MNDRMKLKRKSGLMTANMNGESVMLDIETGKYYNLGETGGRIWALLENPMTVSELVDHLTEEYAVEKAQCAEDVKQFVTALMEKTLVVEA